MGKKDKPRGKMSSYAFFVQTCREEHKKKHPLDTVVFAEFSRKCSEKWKTITSKDKKRFEDMAEKDKGRYERDMANYVPPDGAKPVPQGKKRKDPNAPKRALSAFFFFCNEERAAVRARLPAGSGVGDVAKELGKMWGVCPNKPKFDALAQGDKKRYEKDMAIYKAGGTVAKKAKPSPSPKKVAPPPPEDDDEEVSDEEEEDEEEEEDDQ